MKILLLLTGFLLLSKFPTDQCQRTYPLRQAAQDFCRDCPNHQLTVNPVAWKSYAALRFWDGKHFLAPSGRLAERTPGDYALGQQLRFGEIYFVLGNNREAGLFARLVECVRGRDTMAVILRPRNASDILYDSIPFQPGLYQLIEQGRSLKSPQSFAIYFKRHRAELARANPFTGCQFLERTPQPVTNPSHYAPAIPADIFDLMVGHMKYEQVHYTLRPVTRQNKMRLLKP